MLEKKEPVCQLANNLDDQDSCDSLCVPVEKANPMINQNGKQCRICLQGENQGRIIKPCLCSGSVTYTHEKCLIQWISRKYNPKYKAKVRCEMCQAQFQYKMSKRHSISLDTLKTKMKKQVCNFISFFLISLVMFMGLITLIIIVSLEGADGEAGQYIRQKIIKTQNMKIVYICVTFLILIMLIFLIALFVTEYAVASYFVVKEVQNYPQPTQKNPNKPRRIYPNFE